MPTILGSKVSIFLFFGRGGIQLFIKHINHQLNNELQNLQGK